MSVILSFHLNTPAVQLVEIPTQPGATIKISGLDAGTAFLKKDYFASQSDSGPYLADNGSSVEYIINYLVLYASGKGNGIGKITGSIDIDAGGNIAVTATDIGGNAVVATVAVSGLQRTISLENPTTGGKIEYTTAGVKYVVASVPNDATVILEDTRDNTILPPVAFMITGTQYTLPVLNTVGIPNNILYSVSRNNFITATGKFTVTRTASASNNNTVTFSTDGNEASYTWNVASNPRIATITLVSIATEYDISFAVESISASSVTATLNGIAVTPDSRKHFVIPFVDEDTPLYYTIKADQYHTINGTLLLKPDGSVEDITPQKEKDGTIAYSFDQSKPEVIVQMMPSITIIPTGEKTAILPIGYLLPACFPTGLRIYGDKLSQGKMELVNDTSKDYQIIGVQVTGRPTLNHNVYRTINGAAENLDLPQGHFKFSELRDIVMLANNKYPGQNFPDYYSYLLYYFKNIYVSPFGFNYSNISSLDELDPRDMGTIWGGNVWIEPEDFDGTQADFDAGLVYTTPGPIYKYIENDPRLAALGEKLIAEFAFNFTFDDLKAGPIPYSVSQMSEQNKGLQFLDYVSGTPENILQVSKMFDYILPKNGSITLTQIAMSSNGSYAHNGFQDNGLNFAFEITLIIKVVEPVSYTVTYGANGGSGSYVDPGMEIDLNYTILSTTETGISRPGFTFTGWNTHSDGGGDSYTSGDIIIITDDVTLYAQWIADPVFYIVTYGANGGSGSYIDPGMEYDLHYIILSTIQTGISRKGFLFKGWNTRPDGSGTSYASGDIIAITVDVWLYAQWGQIPEQKRLCRAPVMKCRTAIEGQKLWVDNDNLGNTRPPSVEIILLRDGEVYKRADVDSTGDGYFGFCCLPIWKNSSQKYIYRIDETAVPGYTKTIEGFNVINTLNP